MEHDLDSFEFDKESESLCDELVSRYFEEFKRKNKLPKYRSIQYAEKKTRDILLVCIDGSLLYTPADLGARMNLMAFENGLRSDPEALLRLRSARQWESAIT